MGAPVARCSPEHGALGNGGPRQCNRPPSAKAVKHDHSARKTLRVWLDSQISLFSPLSKPPSRMRTLQLPIRTEKPRSTGLTSLHDVNCSVGELRHILDDFHSFIDYAKLGVGTAYVMPNVQKKVELYHSMDVKVYLGGTLFEKFFGQGKVEDYMAFVRDLGVRTVEISAGSIDISLEERVRLIERFAGEVEVLSEVGSKDAEKIMPPSQWIHEIKSLRAAGSSYVITEGRNSGTAGVYRQSGEIRTGLVADIIKEVGADWLIFEAPTPKAQMFFINQVGANVNLGNIPPHGVLILEAQRQGLRKETFDMDH